MKPGKGTPGQKPDQIRPSQHSEQPQREHSQDHIKIFRECLDEIASEEQAKSEEKENRITGYIEDWHRQNLGASEAIQQTSRPEDEEAQQAKHRNDEAANDENVHKKAPTCENASEAKQKNTQA